MSRIFTLQNEGKIWMGRKYTTYDGLILRCLNEYNVGVQSVRFNQSGSCFSCIDHHGKVILFEIPRNYYHTVPKIRVLPSTNGISFSPKRENEALFALKSFQSISLDLSEYKIISYLNGDHKNPIHSISHSLDGRRSITCSSERVVVWNTKNFDKLKTLVFPEPIIQAKYSKNFLIAMTVSCIHIVNPMNYEIIHKMEVPDVLPPGFCLETFDISENEELLCAGGRGLPISIIWDFKGNRVLKIVAFPEVEKKIKKVKFHPIQESRIFFLTERGKIYEVQLPTLEILSSFTNICTWIDDFDVSVNERNESTSAPPPNRNQSYKISSNNYLICALRNGGIQMYDLDTVRRHNDKLRSFGSGKEEVQFLREWTPKFYQKYEENTEIDIRTRKKTTSSLSQRRRRRKNEKPQVSNNNTSTTRYNTERTSDGEVVFQYEKVKDLLLRKGRFPPQYRKLIWQFLMRLPSNQSKYKTLLGMGKPYSTSIKSTLRPFFTKREESATIYRRMEKLLNVLSNVSPVFALTETTAEVSYPLLQVFQHDIFFCCEFVLCFFHNWGKRWFEFYPNPPISVMNMIEHLLQVYDSKLLDHFKEYRITPKLYCWEIMKNLFTEIFTPKDWLSVMDYILTFSRGPSIYVSNNNNSNSRDAKITGTPMFIFYFVIGFLKYHRKTLLQTRSLEGFETFFHSVYNNNNDDQQYINEIIEVSLSLPSEPGLVYMDYRAFQALGKHEYPLFNLYPKYQVNYQLNRRQRILEEEKRIYRRERRRMDLARKERDAKERIFKKRIEEEEQQQNKKYNDDFHINIRQQQQQQQKKMMMIGGDDDEYDRKRRGRNEIHKTPIPRSKIPIQSNTSTVKFRPSQNFNSPESYSSTSSSSVMTNPKKKNSSSVGSSSSVADTISLPVFPVIEKQQQQQQQRWKQEKENNTFSRIKKIEEEDDLEGKIEDAEEKLQKLQKLHTQQRFKRYETNKLEQRFRKQDEAIRNLRSMSRKKDEKLEKLHKQIEVLKKHKKMKKIWKENKSQNISSSPPLHRSKNYKNSKILTGGGGSGKKIMGGRRRRRRNMMKIGGKKTVAEKIRIKRMRENERKRVKLQKRLIELENKVGSQRSLLQRLEKERKTRLLMKRKRMKEKIRSERNRKKREELKKKRKRIRSTIEQEEEEVDPYEKVIRRRRSQNNHDYDDVISTPEKSSDSSEDVITSLSSSPQQQQHQQQQQQESPQYPMKDLPSSIVQINNNNKNNSIHNHHQQQEQEQQEKELNLSKDQIKQKFQEFIEKRKKKLHEQTSTIPELSWMHDISTTTSSSSSIENISLDDVDDDDDNDDIHSPLDTPTSSANTSIISTEDLSLSELSEETMKIIEEDDDDDDDENGQISRIMDGKISIPIDTDSL